MLPQPSKVAKFVEVAVSLPLDQTFTYAVPEEWSADPVVGQRVLVPFGVRKVTGHIVRVGGAAEPAQNEKRLPRKMKRLLEVLDPEPFLDERMLAFLTWVANYYHAPLGEVLKSATPSGINLESFQTVHVTPKGEALFDDTRVAEARDLVLQTLVEKGAQRIQAIRNLSGVTPKLLRDLVEEELITIDQHLSSLRVKIRKERFVKINVSALAAGMEIKSQKQKKVLSYLEKPEKRRFLRLRKSFRPRVYRACARWFLVWLEKDF